REKRTGALANPDRQKDREQEIRGDRGEHGQDATQDGAGHERTTDTGCSDTATHSAAPRRCAKRVFFTTGATDCSSQIATPRSPSNPSASTKGPSALRVA